MTATMRTLVCLTGLLALAGYAAAQSECPECDEDGTPGVNSSYSSIDLGVVDENLTALADTDMSFSNESSDVWFGWLSICLSAFVQAVEDATGVESNVDANLEVYASEHGVDLDLTVHALDETHDFDDSDLGDLDGMTWDAMAEVRAATGLDLEGGIGDLVPEDIDVDLCITDVDLDLGVSGCP